MVRLLLVATLLIVPIHAAGEDTTTRISGSFDKTFSDGGRLRGTFTCTGVPTCVGQYVAQDKLPECANTLTQSDTLTLTGLNLAASGAISGTITVAGAQFSVDMVGGSCSIRPGSRMDHSTQFSGTWNAATKAGTITFGAQDDELVPVSFIADVSAPAVFPMVVRASIDASKATATADIQFRPQDVSTSGSVFVFAVAPSGRVQGMAGEKADACVISQLDASGRLVAVSSAQLQAHLSGTLAASGASVSILNNTPTPNVAGATFYVGYGTSSSAMLSAGVFRNAVLIPGTEVCPMLPSLTALWWNPSESGWGLNLNHQGSLVFGTLFTYDSARAPMWLVMSAGTMQPDGLTYVGDLYRTTGPAFNAQPFTPIGPGNVTRVGTMSLTFSDVSGGTLSYTVEGVSVTKSIQRQVFGTRAAHCLPTSDSRALLTHYQDLWWNPAESGWGLNVTHQDNTLFATLFTYDATGRGLWLVLPSGVRQGDGSYLGDLYRTTGPPFNSVPFTPIGGSDITNVGSMRLRFADGNNGTLTYTYNGTEVVKAITRQVFSSPASLCN